MMPVIIAIFVISLFEPIANGIGPIITTPAHSVFKFALDKMSQRPTRINKTPRSIRIIVLMNNKY